MLKYLLIIVYLFKTSSVFCQTFSLKNGGVNLGVSFNIGTTVDRIGASVGSFYYYDFIQVNTLFKFFYNFKTFGPSIKGYELQPSLGIIGSFGDKRSDENPFYTVLSNQTRRKYSIGYSFNMYFDHASTSQRTGTILIGIKNFEFLTENDILAAPKYDRFRTGGLKITYLYEKMLFALSTIMWTGNPSSPLSHRINNTDFPSRYGYIDFSEAPYGKFSHGILAAQFKYAIGYGQDVQLSAGIDSERVRNLMQNRLIHDMYFWPKKWNKARNPHLPMLDDHGDPYLYQRDQKLKPSSVYFDLSGNPTLFY